MLYNMSGWAQFFFLFFLFFCGYMFAISLLVFFLDIKTMEQSAPDMRIAMMIQSVGLFLLPALAFSYLCQEDPKKYLKIDYRLEYNPTLLILSILLIIAIQPLIYSISYYNQHMILPESLSSIENWMRETEGNAEKSLNILFSDKSIVGLVFNLLVLAIVAGLAEELFFRGCLQQIIQKIFTNKHIAIWLSAFIFSTVHFQFYGFVPRLLLGALLGYLFIWGGSIWLPIIIHTVHNALNIILTHLYIGSVTYEQIENLRLEDNTPIILFSLFLTILLLYIIRRKSREQIHDFEN